jgi:hypothetical protein
MVVTLHDRFSSKAKLLGKAQLENGAKQRSRIDINWKFAIF